MQDKQPPVLIQVYMADDDGAVREELLARQIDQDTYELFSSPGLAQNLARGDIVSIRDRNAPAEVLKRGGNFCIQIYADYISPEAITALEHDVVRELNGTLDGICEGSLSLAVPAKNGMERINGFFDRFREQTEIQWSYANIYKNLDDDSDETLLYWWHGLIFRFRKLVLPEFFKHDLFKFKGLLSGSNTLICSSAFKTRAAGLKGMQFTPLENVLWSAVKPI